MAIIFTFTRPYLLLFILIGLCNVSKGHGVPGNIPGTKGGFSNKRQLLQSISGITGLSYYVKASATGNRSGSSWQNADTSLASALQNALPGDTIRVAKGTYTPVGGPFVLKDSVVILGGYANTGNPIDIERNWGIYQTILSGEIGFPYNFDNISTIITGNSLHSKTVLDGFIIEKGFANNTFLGVGINLSGSSPEIRNCVFRNNASYNSSLGGSSIACLNSSDPIITNCFFVNNLDLGFGTFFAKYNCKPQLVNCVFAANDGRFVVFSRQSTPVITNCTFFNNQIGNALLPANIRPSFVYADSASAISISNTVFFKNKYKASTDSADIRLSASTLSIVNTITQNYPTGNNYLLSIDPRFKDTANITGTDNFYFTNDDGLQPERCSPVINAGTTSPIVQVLTDILQHPRIYNNLQDIGAYEYQAGNGDDILLTPNDSLVANREYTDQNGWTNYYKDCKLLLSIKKNGQQIGIINDGIFKVVVKTTANYGTATGTNLSQAVYVDSSVSWTALNRYWTVRATKQPVDSISVRFPFSAKDFTDAVAINPAINAPGQLVFYTVDSPYALSALNVPLAKVYTYYSGNTPSTQNWKYSLSDTVHYAEYYVKKISSGGIGIGTGLNNGPFAAINNGCAGINRLFTASLPGNTYQWQISNGNGFIALVENAQNMGTNTNTLTLVSAPASLYGKRFRCQVSSASGGMFFTPVTVLKFEAQWNGGVSNLWNVAANWNCGIVPDKDTDVLIKNGASFAPQVNALLSCRSVRVFPNAVVTVLTGSKLTITGK